MNKQEIIKKFQEKFNWVVEDERIMSKEKNEDGEYTSYTLDDVQNYIFSDIIPEVLKNVLKCPHKLSSEQERILDDLTVNDAFWYGVDEMDERFKKRSKQLYNITL